jgi:hypothetical protein
VSREATAERSSAAALKAAQDQQGKGEREGENNLFAGGSRCYLAASFYIFRLSSKGSDHVLKTILLKYFSNNVPGPGKLVNF